VKRLVPYAPGRVCVAFADMDDKLGRWAGRPGRWYVLLPPEADVEVAHEEAEPLRLRGAAVSFWREVEPERGLPSR